MTADDLDFVAAQLADPEGMRHYPRTYSREESAAWIDRQILRYRRDGFGLWLIVLREEEIPIGQVGLLRQEVEGREEIEVGYLIHVPYWRRGFATEAARGVRDHAFTRLGAERVISLIRPENTPSRGVARKLGMAPQTLTRHGGLPHDVFALSRQDWLSLPRGADGGKSDSHTEESTSHATHGSDKG